MTLIIATPDAIYADRRTVSPLPDSLNFSRACKIHQIREGYYLAADGSLIDEDDYLALFTEFKRAIKDGDGMRMLPGQSAGGVAVLTPEHVYFQTKNARLKKLVKGSTTLSGSTVFTGSAIIAAEGLMFLGYDIPSIFESVSNFDPTVSREFDFVKIKTQGAD